MSGIPCRLPRLWPVPPGCLIRPAALPWSRHNDSCPPPGRERAAKAKRYLTVLPCRTKPEQVDAVIDDGDHEATEHRAEHPAPPAEQADAADDTARDRVQH